jgi:predicted ABC-type ATPase
VTSVLDARPIIVAIAGPNAAGKSTFYRAHLEQGPETCEERVAMRVLQGGHDVPTEKLVARFPRTLANLVRAIRELPHALVFDNTDLGRTYRKVAEFEQGHPVTLSPALPAWLRWD